MASGAAAIGAAAGPSPIVTAANAVADRISKVKQQIEALKERVSGLRQAKEDDIDWESYGRDSSMAFAFNIRRQLRGHFGKVYACDWAGDDTTVLSASQDGKLIVWNGFTENKRELITLRSAWVMACAFERDESQFVASGGLDNVCTVYNLRAVAGGPATELIGHDGYLSDCKWVGKGGMLTSSGDGTLGLWDVERSVRSAAYTDHGADVMGVAVHPFDPHVFASGSCDSTCRVWDTRLGRCVRVFPGHVSDVNSVAFMPTGNCVGTASDDSSTRLFDLRSCGPVNIFTEDRILCGVTDVAFSLSGRLLFGAYEDGFVVAWETLSREGVYHELRGHKARVSCLGVNNCGEALLTGSWDMELAIWA